MHDNIVFLEATTNLSFLLSVVHPSRDAQLLQRLNVFDSCLSDHGGKSRCRGVLHAVLLRPETLRTALVSLTGSFMHALYLFTFFSTLALGSVGLKNISIDDSFSGDGEVNLDYLPPEGWVTGTSGPDPRHAFQGTWHDATQDNNDDSQTYVDINFIGEPFLPPARRQFEFTSRIGCLPVCNHRERPYWCQR